VRAFLPEASEVAAIDEHGGVTKLPQLHEAGLFAGPLPASARNYRLRAR